MDHYGIASILPPVVAIILAIWTRQVFVALLAGIFLGYCVIEVNPITAFFSTIQAMVDVFKDAGNTRTILFCALVGALILLVQLSGGSQGLINYFYRRINIESEQDLTKNIIKIQLYAYLIGMLIFVESSISVLTVGAIFRPIFDKMRISREKLAYICDVSSAPSCILIPFNGWGALLMGLLAIEAVQQPFYVLMESLLFNFYPIVTVVFTTILLVLGKDFGPMALAENRVRQHGELLREGAYPMVSGEVSFVDPHPKAQFKAINMVIPILTMVTLMPIVLIYTGYKSLINKPEIISHSFPEHLINCVSQGSGSEAVLISVLVAISIAAIMYSNQGILTVHELIENIMKGIGGLIPMSILIIFAFAINTLCKELGTGIYVAEITRPYISGTFVPFLLFIVSSIISFTTGSSWGGFAIMTGISVSLANNFDIHLPLAVAAGISGGIFGDHCSPLSDTTIISSMAATTDHIDHCTTQMPYGLICAAITSLLFLIAGIIM